MSQTDTGQIRVGADVGGTFTDVVLIDGDGRIWSQKVPSTPPHFEQAVLDATAHLLRERATAADTAVDAIGARVAEVAHGTTVATNAVLEHRGAKTALVTTAGFRDVLELRRVRTPQSYDLFFTKPPELVERRLRFEVKERIAADGEVLVDLDEAELHALVESLRAESIESVAVCTLHSYAYPQHERAIADYLGKHLSSAIVSISSEVLPERKEYERTATTVVNAYVRPIMEAYLDSMRSGLAAQKVEAPLLIMQSTGGLTPDDDAARRPVFALESGPAAGVLAASFTASQLGISNLITLDMGGTTAKASMIEDGRISYSPEYEVGASLSAGNRLVGGGGELIRAPSIDIAEVGAGGGSIAFLDRAGGLRVGPRSAGAVPGPACYGRGGEQPTLTDANVVLGYIRPGELADGEVSIDLEAAERSIKDQIAGPAGLELRQAAEGIHRIANARTMRALRAVSTERGRDARDFALMAFGGSGPIHAAGLARELRIGRLVVPPLPGLFSALGLLFSGIEHHKVRSCLLSGFELTPGALTALRAPMQRELLSQFESEGVTSAQVVVSCAADVRYKGQASEIRIAVAGEQFDDGTVAALCEAFEQEHERLYGHRSDDENPVEVIALRLVGRAGGHDQEAGLQPARADGAGKVDRDAYFAGELLRVPVVDRDDLRGGGRAGPLLVDEYDSTIVVPPGVRAASDERGYLVMDIDDG